MSRDILHKDWLDNRLNTLFNFGISSKTYGGFGYLEENGQIDPEQNIQTYITCRMTHIYSMFIVDHQHETQFAKELEVAKELATHGVKSLIESIQDHEHGGFFEAIKVIKNEENGQFEIQPTSEENTKVAYAHAFVLLAASSAVYANIDRAEELFELIVKVEEKYFWDEETKKTIESYKADWSGCEKYRGVNAAMHTVEAFLNVDSMLNKNSHLSETDWLERAKYLTDFVFETARNNNYMIPEHFDENWNVIWDYNFDDKAHQFRPYGATVGHAMEWARLGVQLVLSYYKRQGHISEENLALLKDCVGLYNVALQSWGVDGKEGFVYTTDFEGKPIVRDRMHWVLCEAIGATVALKQAKNLLDTKGISAEFMDTSYGINYFTMPENADITSIPEVKIGYLDFYDYWYLKFISYADKYVINDDGLWNHQLDENNNFSSSIWSGRPDIYHAYQALWFAKNQNIFLTKDL
ncbi:AGE family epimerase/isomerase [Actinomyces sp. zg-332]|uniref:AGE family epimerase/isomerase n=1 Tax=Actinomyces sp. zg-332 TaxID=2708340 RepID=UPI00141F358E|nr:AGE family epimerase/isomerase [Actinomyces sp. zg-332]QPK94070.1 AGE family epimerase/isomerase [Actinomyces sp. zg-332]